MEANNQGMDLLVSFDTTGSMYPVLSRVRVEVEQLINDLMKEIADLRIGIIAHGDYCDKDDPYTIKVLPFTNDIGALCKFVNETEQTYGGDADECYELVLNTAKSMLDWRSDRNKAFILIGDASPHGVEYHSNTMHLDWKNEAQALANMGVKIFSVHALSYYRSSSKSFYNYIARVTNGKYLTLDQFNEVVELIKATCLAEFSEEKLTEYISIIRSKGRMTRTLAQNLGRLQGEDYKYMGGFHSDSSLTPVKPGRFQAMEVTRDCDIRGFVTSNGIEFKRGRGFYELTKHETVQQYKEIIIQDRDTGEMFTGGQVREKLGLLPQCDKGGAKESLSSYDTGEYRIFVQSTSFNRKLIGGTTFLYEINDFEDTGTTISAEPKATGDTKSSVKKTEKATKATKADKKTKGTDAVKETKESKEPKGSKKAKATEEPKVTKPEAKDKEKPKSKTKAKPKAPKKVEAKATSDDTFGEASGEVFTPTKVLSSEIKTKLNDKAVDMIVQLGMLYTSIASGDMNTIRHYCEMLSDTTNSMLDTIK